MDWGWAIPILESQKECLTCVCVWVAVMWVWSECGAWTRVWRGEVVLCLCDLRVWIICVDGPGICILCQVGTCASYVHPVFNTVTPDRYLPPTVYLCWQISQIQTCLRVVVGPGSVSTSPAFMRSIATHHAVRMTDLPKNGKST